METPILNQLKTAARFPLASAVGALFGGLVPIGSFILAHYEIPTLYHYKTGLVLACVLFSSWTVYDWGCELFGNRVKAAAYAVLLEGFMVLSGTLWLAAAALALLVLTNGVAVGCCVAEKGFENPETLEAERKPAPSQNPLSILPQTPAPVLVAKPAPLAPVSAPVRKTGKGGRPRNAERCPCGQNTLARARHERFKCCRDSGVEYRHVLALAATPAVAVEA